LTRPGRTLSVSRAIHGETRDDMKPPHAIPTAQPMLPDGPAGRISPWRIDRLIHRACLACGSDRSEGNCARPGRIGVAPCLDCGMARRVVWLVPGRGAVGLDPAYLLSHVVHLAAVGLYVFAVLRPRRPAPDLA